MRLILQISQENSVFYIGRLGAKYTTMLTSQKILFPNLFNAHIAIKAYVLK